MRACVRLDIRLNHVVLPAERVSGVTNFQGGLAGLGITSTFGTPKEKNLCMHVFQMMILHGTQRDIQICGFGQTTDTHW
jgi:hypothetical protein